MDWGPAQRVVVSGLAIDASLVTFCQLSSKHCRLIPIVLLLLALIAGIQEVGGIIAISVEAYMQSL